MSLPPKFPSKQVLSDFCSLPFGFFFPGRRSKCNERYVAVGDEPFLQSYGEQFHPFVIGAAMNIQSALAKANLASEVKVVLCNFERHWGVFTFDGQAEYRFNVGQGSKNLTNAQFVEYLPSKWCVVNNNKDFSKATASALEACSVSDCTELSPGSSCSNISWPGNISYAFNSYYQQQDQRADSCDFGGLGLITTVDPSIDNCRYFVELQNSHSTSAHEAYHFLRIILLMAYLFNVYWVSHGRERCFSNYTRLIAVTFLLG